MRRRNDMKDKEKIKIAVADFTREMETKLLNKLEQGFHGWDDDKEFPDSVLENKLRDHTRRLIECGENEEIDIANFCMMLRWRRIHRKLSEERKDGLTDRKRLPFKAELLPAEASQSQSEASPSRKSSEGKSKEN
jgi:hypothetical protein